MNTEKTRGAGSEELYPHHPGWFEDWLYEQRHRQDDTGAVARFVIEDYEKGCWPDTLFLDTLWVRTDEKLRKEWTRHLILHHNLSGKSIIAFERVHKEYVGIMKRCIEGWGWSDDSDFVCLIQVGKLDPKTKPKDNRPYWVRAQEARGDKRPDLWDYRHLYSREGREKLRKELGR